jgi:hypothetical protein
MRIVALLVGVWMFVAARPAEACGAWGMDDKEKSWHVHFLINSASITNAKDKRVGAFYLDIESKDGIKVVANKKVVFDVKAGKLRKFGKAIATIDGDTVTFGKKQYTIALTDPHKEHQVMSAWKLAVTRDGETIVEAEHASSLCAGLHKEMSEADKEEEVRRRVMFYLAWREVGGK